MKNILKSIIVMFTLTSFFSCGEKKEATKEYFHATLTADEISSGKFTPEVLLKLGRLSEQSLSPDGKMLLYAVSVPDVENNRSRQNLYIAHIGDTISTTVLTLGATKDWNARWGEQGRSIFFLSNRSGETAMWRIGADGKGLKQLKSFPKDMGGFEISPKGDKIWYTTQIKVDVTAQDLYPELKKAKVMIYDDLMARHWNYWLDGSYSHIFTATFDGNNISDSKDIMENEPWDAPLAPYFDLEEITWNNAGTQIAYTCKKLKGTEYAVSTDSDIYIYDLGSGKTENITKGMVGYDKYPVFSEDDKMLINLETKDIKYLTKDFDYNVSSLQWTNEKELYGKNENDKRLYFIGNVKGNSQIFFININDNSINQVTDIEGTYDALEIQNGVIAATKSTFKSALEAELVYDSYRPDRGNTALTAINKDIYDVIKMGDVQKRWIKTTDGGSMLTYVFLPPGFDPAKKYPTLLYCQGGPQSPINDGWSFRWNFQLMSSQGYVVVAPNRHGTVSFGQKWTDQISGDYSGQNISDYLVAIDSVSSEKWVDKDKLGCVGASYGGYSVYYLAGHHQKRFKAFISHCGMFNFESFYGSTEELWFPNNDLGGAYWDESNPTAQRSYANSPHKFVKNWDTPIMIMVGQLDYRIPYTESLQAFTAARAKGVEARIVVFEDEGHQVFKPQNALIWHTEYYKWLDKYLK